MGGRVFWVDYHGLVGDGFGNGAVEVLGAVSKTEVVGRGGNKGDFNVFYSFYGAGFWGADFFEVKGWGVGLVSKTEVFEGLVVGFLVGRTS